MKFVIMNGIHAQRALLSALALSLGFIPFSANAGFNGQCVRSDAC